MNAWLQAFHFLRPWWLAALLLLPLLGWLGSRRDAARQSLSRLVDAELLPHLLRGRAVDRQTPLWLFALGWTLFALAMAGPTWNRVAQPLYANRAAQVVAISLSKHMLAHDVTPSRIDRARYKAHDLLQDNHDGLNALIGYAGEAFVVAPLTSDANSLDDLLDAMAPDTMPMDGNDAALAIQRGVALIHDANASGGSLVLITDQADAAAQTAAHKALAAGMHVSVLGIGTPQGGPVPLPGGGFLHDRQGHMVLAARDDKALAALAAAGGGRYVAMSGDRSDVDVLHGQLQVGNAKAASGHVGDQWQDRGPWLLLPLLLVAALAFRRGWLLLLPLVLLPLLPATARAGTWSNLWQRPDQQAAQALRQGHPKQAQQLAQDPAWRGAAAYRAADYAAAAQSLKQSAGTDADYNLGNALARQGKYRQAIAAYDRALKLDPNNADAGANRKAVEDWLKQQQKKSKSGDKSSSGQKSSSKDGGKSSPSKDGQGKPDDQQGKTGAEGKSADNPEQDKENPDQNPSDQTKPDQDKSGAGKPGADKPDRDGKSGQDQPSSPDKDQGDTPTPPPDGDKTPLPGAASQAEQQAQADKAQQALRKQMDQALAGDAGDKDKDKSAPTHQLGAADSNDPQSKLPANLRRALQRVPDDPGALLRRKFELEYQQRHGGAPDEDGQP